VVWEFKYEMNLTHFHRDATTWTTAFKPSK